MSITATHTVRGLREALCITRVGASCIGFLGGRHVVDFAAHMDLSACSARFFSRVGLKNACSRGRDRNRPHCGAGTRLPLGHTFQEGSHHGAPLSAGTEAYPAPHVINGSAPSDFPPGTSFSGTRAWARLSELSIGGYLTFHNQVLKIKVQTARSNCARGGNRILLFFFVRWKFPATAVSRTALPKPCPLSDCLQYL